MNPLSIWSGRAWSRGSIFDQENLNVPHDSPSGYVVPLYVIIGGDKEGSIQQAVIGVLA